MRHKMMSIITRPRNQSKPIAAIESLIVERNVCIVMVIFYHTNLRPASIIVG